MKKIEVKIETKEIRFQATDGSVFKNEKECKIYEESYIGLLKADYSKLKKSSIIENEFVLFTGSVDFLLDIVQVENEFDVELLLKLSLYYNSHIRNDETKIVELKARLTSAIGEKIVIGRGVIDCNGDIMKNYEYFSVFNTLDFYINRLKDFNK